MKEIVVGLLAHVDAGKTTLSESLLYKSGTIRTQGRVDHESTFLDYDQQERKRGITIFSKLSSLTFNNTKMTFIDTPGHVDFSGEMERALSILDYAIVIISGSEGVQSHTKTIWKLLEHYHVPAFFFVNKMDMSHYSEEELLSSLHTLSDHIVKLDNHEEVAMCSESLLDSYLEKGKLSDEEITSAIASREVFPVLFGSALKNEKTVALLEMIDQYTKSPSYKDNLSGIVYKVSHDESGERLVHIRLTGGSLKLKDEINGEKINQVRIYQGANYTLSKDSHAGEVVTLTGIKNLEAGDVFGDERAQSHFLKPYLLYDIDLPEGEDQRRMLKHLTMLKEEEPLLHMKMYTDHVQVSLMGDVQIEILKDIMKERFHEDITIGNKKVAYKETITSSVEGVGHFEPLRHYAEVHLYLEPLNQGEGLQFVNNCQNNLPEHYQRLIMTHLQEKEHLGVLSGSPITDMRITLLGGKAHDKHTEGGDFREATYRAIRQGLKSTTSILLEPYGHYTLVIPSMYLSKAFYDFENYDTPRIEDDDGTIAILKGEAPLRFLSDYQLSVLHYTKGEGSLMIEEVVYSEVKEDVETDYDSELDRDNPTGSIFCSHGAGYYVKYDEVENKMHLPFFSLKKENTQSTHHAMTVSDEEVRRVYEQTYGKQERKLAKDFYGAPKEAETSAMMSKRKEDCLLVDGYNVIYADKKLTEIANENLGAARDHLVDALCSYQGFKKGVLIIVFDAYQVEGGRGSMEPYHNVYIVYTKEAQTADAYIESATKKLASEYNVIVATSDYAEQKIVVGHGATRLSARELLLEMEAVKKEEFSTFERKNVIVPNTLMEDLDR